MDIPRINLGSLRSKSKGFRKTIIEKGIPEQGQDP